MSVLADTLKKALWDYKSGKRRAYRSRSNNASKLGHPCIRFLVMIRTTDVDNIEKFSVESQFRMDDGKMFEAGVRRELRDMGFTLTRDEQPFEYASHQIGGKIDNMIEIQGEEYPLEIKKASPWFLKTIMNCVIDGVMNLELARKSRNRFLWQYIVQLNVYCLMANKEKGLFALKDPVTGIIHFVELHLGYELGERTLQIAEEVNEHIAQGTLPNHCGDPRVCGDCQLVHVCEPPVLDTKGKDVKIVMDEGLEALIDEWTRLKPERDEWNHIDEELKARLRGFVGIVGKYFVDGKWSTTPEKWAEPKKWKIMNGIPLVFKKEVKKWLRTIRELAA